MCDGTNIWVCEDCYITYHYGATKEGGEWYAGENDIACHAEPLGKIDHENYRLADNVNSEAEDPAESGIIDFSSGRCRGCYMNFAGTRYRLHMFKG